MSRIPGFTLESLLGRGASGEVFAATRHRDGARCAVKLLASSADHAAWEATRAGDNLEGVVAVQEVLALPDGGSAIVMDLVEGGSLGAVLSARGRLSVPEAVTVLVPLAQTLGRLAASGITHGDLSPGNVLLTRHGRPLLADLGAGRGPGEVPADDIFGTSGFAAPELEVGEAPSPAADVYAWGALGWHCLTGEPPPYWMARDRVPRLLAERGWDSAEHAALGGLLEQAMSFDPSARPDAVTLAVDTYAVCRPRPLRLVTDPSQVSSITERIRVVARDHPEPMVGRHRRDQPCWPERLRALGRRAALPLAATVVLGVLGVGIISVQDRAGALAPTQRPTSAAPAPDLRLARTIAPSSARGVLQALVDARAACWRSGSPAGLAEAVVPGSAAWQRDSRLLDSLERSGTAYAGLNFRVRSAVPASLSENQVVIRASVDATAYEVRTPTGSVAQAARAGPALDVVLQWTSGGWRVADIREPA